MASEPLLFATRAEFRSWLERGESAEGVWLLFGKKGGPQTLKAAEALEEALCFGWIDGQMQSIDETRYRKYFAPRRPQSAWSEKNRKLVAELEKRGLMTQAGRAAIEESKRRGTWEGAPRQQITDEQVQILADALRGHQPAYANYQNMTPSARRAYAGGYLSVKTEDGRRRKLEGLIERLNLNLNPMESIHKARERREPPGE